MFCWRRRKEDSALHSHHSPRRGQVREIVSFSGLMDGLRCGAVRRPRVVQTRFVVVGDRSVVVPDGCRSTLTITSITSPSPGPSPGLPWRRLDDDVCPRQRTCKLVSGDISSWTWRSRLSVGFFYVYRTRFYVYFVDFLLLTFPRFSFAFSAANCYNSLSRTRIRDNRMGFFMD